MYRGNPRDGCYFYQESNDKRMKAKNDQENPRDGCYFYQESNDKRMKAKNDQEGLLPRLCFCGGSEKNRFQKCRFKIFLNFSYKEQLTVSFIRF